MAVIAKKQHKLNNHMFIILIKKIFNEEFYNTKMDRFIEKYRSRIDVILAKPSGIYPITRHREWLDRLPAFARKYGEMFIDNVNYIRWNDLVHNLKYTLVQLLERPLKPYKVWYIGSNSFES
jgi:hypothetical protein